LTPISPSSRPVLSHVPGQGAAAPALGVQTFKDMLQSQSRPASPTGGVPSEAEAKITAAQIASQANVRTGLKHDPVVAGMNTAARPPIAAQPGRFIPLHEGPGGARNFTAPAQNTANTSVESLRATSKFSPGPVNNAGLAKPAPVLARAQKIVPPEAVPSPPPAETFAYGLGAAGSGSPAQVPAWFDSAVQDALNKYDAMKKKPQTP
jgi:hypothetical protein